MKFLCFISLLFLLCFQLEGQNVDFVFNKEFNNLIALKEGKSPYAYEILSQERTSSIKKPSTKRISEFYKRALAFAEKAKSDSTKIAQLKKESRFTPEIAKKLNETEVNNRLNIARRSLKTTEKYETVPSEVIIETYNELKIRRNIFKPQHVIIGKFKSLGSYYVTKAINRYNDSCLISVADAKKDKLTKEHFLFDDVFEVIQNIETDAIYMVYPVFLEKYPINKIAAQKQYKDKVDLSKKTYTNTIDKALDSLILNYKKVY
ncbi:hypothetical protein [Flavivirga eckloniae]|uniref:DUF4294 domain-containing protein n=1 Tax=Flavivirga eckloniae TaxID=1803846 RepID=A0A2K9PJU6_9FLAO|nr:hypothetical protein [Flavivirga eckloniae]AUP77329.1 hypothetical protein C1H87_00780 [Flavivirga eckloniae]